MARPEPSKLLLARLMSALIVAGLAWFALSILLMVVPEVQRRLFERQIAPYLTVLSQGDPTNARARFDRDVAAHPADPAVYEVIATACARANRYDLAVEYLNKGLLPCKDAPRATRSGMYLQLSQCYAEIEKTRPQTQAVLAAQRAVELDPDSPNCLNAYGYLLADNDLQLEEAQRTIVRALQLLKNEPDDPDTQREIAGVEDSYGWVLFKLRRYDKAVSALNEAIADLPPASEFPHDLDPKAYRTEIGEIYYHLGAAFSRENNAAAARQALQTALSYAPDNRLAKTAMDALDRETAATDSLPKSPPAGRTDHDGAETSPVGPPPPPAGKGAPKPETPVKTGREPGSGP